jgi:hypothetical protein
MSMGTAKLRRLAMAGVALAALAGCKKPEAKQATAPEAIESSIRDQSATDGVRVTTKSAEFLLGATGSLRATLLNGNEKITLEEAGSGTEITVGKKVVTDFVGDVAHAGVGSAKGKPGRLGKRIEVKARAGGNAGAGSLR